MSKISYVLPVKEIKKRTALDPINLEETYIIGSDTRDSGNLKEIGLDKNDGKKRYYQLIYNDNTSWIADPDTLKDLFGDAVKSERGAENVYKLPLVLDNSSDRGIAGKIALKLIHIFIKPAKERHVKNIAEDLEKKNLNGREGLNTLNQQLELVDFVPKNEDFDSNAPYLLFIHGTNSNTTDAFGGLKKNAVYSQIFDLYRDKILTFQHRTLTQSPLKNAVDLVTSLPDNATLHIISHSRGGLIGEILSKYASKKGFLKEQIDLLKKENRTEDLENIKKLDAIFRTKNIKVEKFIRVASPSAGTILASDRIDHILNVFFNLIGEKANLFADLMHELIGAVLKEKSNINTLPGLEAMNPQSPFIKVLNSRNEETEIDGNSLMVISGNGKLSISFRGLLVILGKLYYQQRSDLVVNTDSMYLGVKRKGHIQYFFDEGTDVDHIHYFGNIKTQGALLNALKTPVGKIIEGYKSVLQLEVPATDRGVFGIDNGELFPSPDVPTGKKPIVILLPGIMGSNIYEQSDGDDKETRLWLNYWKIINGGLKEMENINNPESKALSIIKSSYNKLYKHLSFNYDVVIHPFDWRQSMENSSKKLNDKIVELLKLNKPIKIIGHSMGGVLVRDFIVYHPGTWQKLNNSPNFKLLFLGAPLKGSHRILTVLFGRDSIINKLSFLDTRHTKKELVEIFSTLPGILSLLPLTTAVDQDFSNYTVWDRMRIALQDPSWPIPGSKPTKQNKLLTEFKTYRDRVNEVSASIDYSNISYIAGHDKATPSDYTIENDKLFFEYTIEGDQSVTWESGIPTKLIEQEQVYYVDVTHGALADEPKIFSGIEDIISKGSTNKLSKKRPVFRGSTAKFRINELNDFDLSERGLENTLLGINTDTEISISQNPITLSISHGDLAYASFPVLAGHFKNDAILFAEKSIDSNLNSLLKYKHQFGGYPGEIETSEIVYKQDDFFEGAIIIGLGEPGKLTSHLLSKSIEVGISNYLLGISNKADEMKTIGISPLLIGSGYGGLTVENSIKAIIEGVNNANRNIMALEQNYTTIKHIEFIEQYEAKSINCLFAIKNIENHENDNYNIKLLTDTIKKLFGSRKKLPIENTEEWWNRMTVKSRSEEENGVVITKSLQFNASSGDARDEEKELFTNTSLVNSFINKISTENNWSDTLAKTLFELLIPNDFKDQLKRKGQITWVLDKESAAYPWELLQDGSLKAQPLCINAGMIRQLSTRNYRLKINRFVNEKAFVVADPELGSYLNMLDGAKNEGLAVERMLIANNYDNLTLINATSGEIAEALYSDSYKIIHLAGHGIYDPKNKKVGMVIGDEIFLTPSDINQLPTVPELVFVNCCHLGKVDSVDEKLYRNRYQLAANIGTQLIEIGVKVVIVAGWKVADTEARIFAETFYERMFAGETFGNAVKKARLKIYNVLGSKNNTWGAYQCYGDPHYKLINRTTKESKENKKYVIEAEVYIDLENLLNRLDVRNIKKEDILKNLSIITKERERADIDSARINETEAMIYYELGMYKEALEKFEELKNRENAQFSVNALEKYCTAQSYKSFEDYKENRNESLAMSEMNSIIQKLEALIIINNTTERMCLTASVYKKLGFVRTEKEEKLKAYENAVEFYKKAFDKSGDTYPLNNYLIFRTILDLDKADNDAVIKPEDIPKHIATLNERRKNLINSNINMDYWDSADYTVCSLTILFLDKTLSDKDNEWEVLLDKYKQIRKRYGSIGKKKVELFNLELIIDVFSTLDMHNEKIKNTHANQLRNRVKDLKSKLDNEVFN